MEKVPEEREREDVVFNPHRTTNCNATTVSMIYVWHLKEPLILAVDLLF
jgi:hypothetical protein